MWGGREPRDAGEEPSTLQPWLFLQLYQLVFVAIGIDAPRRCRRGTSRGAQRLQVKSERVRRQMLLREVV
jgi:hypothetical protein